MWRDYQLIEFDWKLNPKISLKIWANQKVMNSSEQWNYLEKFAKNKNCLVYERNAYIKMTSNICECGNIPRMDF